jgi:hypothetical protein
VLLTLTDQERAALEAGADRLGVGMSEYLRELIVSAGAGERPPAEP